MANYTDGRTGYFSQTRGRPLKERTELEQGAEKKKRSSPESKIKRLEKREKEKIQLNLDIKRDEKEKEAKDRAKAKNVATLAIMDANPGMMLAEARAKAEAQFTEKTDTTGLTFATTPEEAASQEEPMSDWDKARGQIYAGQRELDTAYGAQREAEKKLAEAQAGQLSEENELADEQDKAYGRQVRALESMQKINRAKLDDYDKGTAELEEDYNNSKIDPNRAFSSTGSKVAAAIAIALGAFAQGMSRGQMPNSALQIIEGAIKRDVDAQKTEMQKNRDVLLNRNNIYARMMARFNNEEVAYRATMALAFKHAGMKMKGLLRKHKGENAQLTINASLAKMDSKQKELHLGNRKLLAEITVKEAQFQARSGAVQAKQDQSTDLALKTIALLPKLQKDFLNVTAMQGAWGLVLPKTVKSWFSGMADEITYENSKNLNAKALTKAFDGGRPTEKDFQIFVQMFPEGSTEQSVGVEQFRNIRENLTTMIIRGKGLKPGYLAEAWESQYGEIKVSPEAKALREKAKSWEFKQGM